jgi:hypothetical protein
MKRFPDEWPDLPEDDEMGDDLMEDEEDEGDEGDEEEMEDEEEDEVPWDEEDDSFDEEARP